MARVVVTAEDERRMREAWELKRREAVLSGEKPISPVPVAIAGQKRESEGVRVDFERLGRIVASLERQFDAGVPKEVFCTCWHCRTMEARMRHILGKILREGR